MPNGPTELNNKRPVRPHPRCSHVTIPFLRTCIVVWCRRAPARYVNTTERNIVHTHCGTHAYHRNKQTKEAGSTKRTLCSRSRSRLQTPLVEADALPKAQHTCTQTAWSHVHRKFVVTHTTMCLAQDHADAVGIANVFCCDNCWKTRQAYTMHV